MGVLRYVLLALGVALLLIALQLYDRESCDTPRGGVVRLLNCR